MLVRGSSNNVREMSDKSEEDTNIVESATDQSTEGYAISMV